MDGRPNRRSKVAASNVFGVAWTRRLSHAFPAGALGIGGMYQLDAHYVS